MVAFTFIQLIFAVIQGVNWNNWFHNKQSKYGTELLCSQASQFIPNFCEYTAAKKNCKDICERYHGTKEMLRCGDRQFRSLRRQRRVVGGSVSRSGEWPWRVGLLVRDKHWCGGTILSEYFVLTAWHCFTRNTSLNAVDWVVISGENTLQHGDIGEQAVRVKKLIRHPTGINTIHDQDKNKTYAVIEDDIAILALEKPIEMDGVHRSPVCLPDIKQSIPDYQAAYVSGWGQTHFAGEVSHQLRHAQVPVVPTSVCNSENTYNNTINGKKILCAGYKDGGIDACFYDSGGSLDYQFRGKWYAIGIVSSGFECARPNAYGLYTNISSYIEWIIDAILVQVDK